MPTQDFEVESYDLTVRPRGTPYEIFLTSIRFFHNTRSRAVIRFVPAESSIFGSDFIGYAVGLMSLDDVTVYAWADEKYFDSMYHILQTEDPVSFRFGYSSGTRNSSDLDWFSLTTADEPTGEGFNERALHSLVSAGEVDLDEVDAELLGVEDEFFQQMKASFDTEETDG